MKIVLALMLVILVMPALVFAASVKIYQVTGPVLEVSDTMIALQKGQDRWELARDKDTEVTGDLKVGAKVTVQYRINATKMEAKEEKNPTSSSLPSIPPSPPIPD
jgi:hypothetical protein